MFSSRHISELNDAVLRGTPKDIAAAKYKLLHDASNLFEIVINYIVLEEKGICFDYGINVIKKGTKLFRIRSYKDGTDYSEPSAWTPPPQAPLNRANRKGQTALYLSSAEAVCLLETHTAINQSYILGEYECMENITVGGFLKFDDSNDWHNLAGMVLNAFLIAPSREERNDEIFAFLDKHYGKLTPNDLSDYSYVTHNGGLELPFQFTIVNQGSQLHEVTNMLCDALTVHTPEGLRYSSCYIPLEAPGISCTHYNLVLYEKALSKIRFVKSEVKTKTTGPSSLETVRALIGQDGIQIGQNG